MNETSESCFSVGNGNDKLGEKHSFEAVLWIRTVAAFYLSADPYPDPGSQSKNNVDPIHADPASGQTLPSQKS
jgi:hypothetical protein